MAIEYDGIPLDMEEDFSPPSMESSSPSLDSGPIEYDGIPLEAPSPDVPFITENVKDLPTVKSLGELPGDLVNRALTHAKGGVESFVGGFESLAPGSENTIWRRRQEKETPVQYLLSKLAPLGIVGGPVETIASPLTALFSEGARLGGEVERKVRGLSPEDTPFLHKAEPFAPMAGSLAVAPFIPTWLGGMKKAAEASSAGANLRAAKRAAEGYQSSEGALKGITARGSEAAGDLGSMLRTTAAEGDRLAALAGGEARFRPGMPGRTTEELMPTTELGAANTSRLEQLRTKFPERATTAIPDRPIEGDLSDPGLLSRLQKLKKEDPESYEQIILAANPQSQVARREGFEVFSKSKTSPYWQRGLSRTASEYVHVPEELADDVEKFARAAGRTGRKKGKVELTEENLMSAFNKRFGSDETGVGDAVLEKLAQTTLQLREGTMTVPWVQPLKSTGLAEVQPSLRSILHSSRGLGVRAQRQLGARALTAEGENVRFTRAPAGTYWPHAYEPETSAAIRAEKEAARMKAGQPVTTQHDIISGEDFTNMTRGARARRGSEETNKLVQDYIKDPIRMINTNSQNWGRMLGRTSSLGPKGEKWTAKIKQLVDEVGQKLRRISTMRLVEILTSSLRVIVRLMRSRPLKR
jgi:hypothetical protein